MNQPQKYHYWPAVDISLNATSSWEHSFYRQLIESAIEPLAGEAVPEITLGKFYPAARALAMDDLPQRLSLDARDLGPYFEWLGTSKW